MPAIRARTAATLLAPAPPLPSRPFRLSSRPTSSSLSRLALLLLLFLLATPPLASANSCPNACSGKGNCNSYGQCACWTGYTGADCSLRTCTYDYAWTGYASATDTLHSNTAECSNMGICDRKTGICECFDGFGGQACERILCPGKGNCNGNGRCISLRDAATTQDDRVLLYAAVYTLWDADKVRIITWSCFPG